MKTRLNWLHNSLLSDQFNTTNGGQSEVTSKCVL